VWDLWIGWGVGVDLLHDPTGYRQVDEDGVELNRTTTLDDVNPETRIGSWQ
jgi:hypothetical protein